MDQSDKKCKFLKTSLQFIFSVSVLSFVVWYSCGFSMLSHDDSFINAYFSTFLFSVFTHTLERKYMFLLCNAILAFLAKTSLMSTTSSPSSSMSAFDIEASSLSETMALPVSEEEKEQEHCEEEEVSEGGDEQEDGGSIEASNIVADQEDDVEEEEVGKGGSEVLVVTEDDEADATMTANEEVSNADELNRKFEEFIRKMKEEIRIEAQRQLIAV